jgi:hypothetical protein
VVTSLFHAFLYAHIATGAVGLIAFWVPIATRKGARAHVAGGRLFARCMLATGAFAVGLSLCTLIAPLPTHPAFEDAALVRGIFGWMMLYLAVLTVNLAWYGLLAVRNRHDHRANRTPVNLASQWLLLALSINCAVQGALIGQALMMGISLVGVAAAVTNLRFLNAERPARVAWQLEHVKALIGAGISVYTAFLAFGAVRLLPEAALSPVLWAAPLAVGLVLIFVFQRRIVARYRAAKAAARATELAS